MAKQAGEMSFGGESVTTIARAGRELTDSTPDPEDLEDIEPTHPTERIAIKRRLRRYRLAKALERKRTKRKHKQLQRCTALCEHHANYFSYHAYKLTQELYHAEGTNSQTESQTNEESQQEQTESPEVQEAREQWKASHTFKGGQKV